MRNHRRLAVLSTTAILDVVAAVLFLVIITILVTGGGILTIGDTVIRARTVTNPLAALAVVLAIRFARFYDTPLFFTHATPHSLGEASRRLCAAVVAGLRDQPHRRVVLGAVVVIAASAVIKIVNAYFYFGFYSGDDVEVHEMTFAYLFDWDWEPSSLRSPIYPFVFILPAQALAVAVGAVDPGVLIFVGRLMVVGMSLATLWLVYLAGSSLSGRPGVGLLACCVLALSKLHTAFGSTELPRSVAAAFLVLAFMSSRGPAVSSRSAALTGVWIACAGVLRFSEFVFVIPEFIRLIARRQLKCAAALVAACAAVGLLLVTAGDGLYWGEPGYSLRNAIDFTLIQGGSTRGYEPWHYYLSQAGTWTNPVWLVASLVSARFGYWRVFAWTWIPVLILSGLPHKEARYMVPVLPFLALSAAFTLHRWLEMIGRLPPARARKPALALITVVSLAVMFELGGFRFRRSEAAVRVARELAPTVAGETLAIEQAWRMGDRLYFPKSATLVEPADYPPASRQELLCAPSIALVALRSRDVLPDESVLTACGFRTAALESDSEYRVYVRRDEPQR